MKTFLRIALTLFCLVLALPLMRMTTGFPSEHALHGVDVPAKKPEATVSGWWKGTWQAGFDAWIQQGIGLRGTLVRMANQINFRLFNELPKRKGTQVLMGREGFLFEKVYVDAYNKGYNRPEGKPSPLPELRGASAALRRLQDRLARDGIALLLLIAPSKAEIYPEFLPDSADVAGRPQRRSTYQNLVGFLRQDGVNLVDAHELFLEWRRAPDAPLLFAKGGTHWNQYGAARVVEHTLQRLRALTGKDLPHVTITGSVTNRTVVDSDNDLSELVNLWSDHTLAGPQVHPVVEAHPGSHPANLLFIGDSFVFTLTNFMDRNGLYQKRDTYYYYSRRYSYPAAQTEPLDRRRLNLLAELRGRDAVVIEINEYWLPRIGFGVVRDLLKAYDALDAKSLAKPPAS